MFNNVKWELLLPKINTLLSLLREHPGHFLHHWWSTFSVSSLASVLALSLGLILSVIALRYKYIDYAATPVVGLSQSFPLQAITPLIIIVFGVGIQTKIIIATIIAFFPIYGACITALKTTPKPILAHLHICNSTFLKGVWLVRIPAAMPAIVSSAKVGFTLAVLGAVVAEFIHPDDGLGHLLLVAQSNYNVEVVYICIVILMLQGIIVYGGLTFLESYLIKKRGK